MKVKDHLVGYDPDPDLPAFGPLTAEQYGQPDPYTTVYVLCKVESKNGQTRTTPVSTFTFRADAERVLSLMEMGKRLYAIPEHISYSLTEVAHDATL